MWDDSVAPEAALDFDAPHVSTKEVLLGFFAGFAFFGSLLTLVYLSDPVASNPVARRASVIPDASMLNLGYAKNNSEEE